jgi:hypothetical protein
MADEVDFDFMRNWPPDSAVELRPSDHRGINGLVADRIEGAPTLTDMGTRRSRVLVVRDDGQGFTIIGLLATEADFGNMPVGGFKPRSVTESASFALTDEEHGGSVVWYRGVGPATVSVAITGDPTTGVSSGFRCEVRRAVGAGALQFLLSTPLVNANPNGDTRVQARRPVVVSIDGNDAYLDAYTSP